MNNNHIPKLGDENEKAVMKPFVLIDDQGLV